MCHRRTRSTPSDGVQIVEDPLRAEAGVLVDVELCLSQSMLPLTLGSSFSSRHKCNFSSAYVHAAVNCATAACCRRAVHRQQNSAPAAGHVNETGRRRWCRDAAPTAGRCAGADSDTLEERDRFLPVQFRAGMRRTVRSRFRATRHPDRFRVPIGCSTNPAAAVYRNDTAEAGVAFLHTFASIKLRIGRNRRALRRISVYSGRPSGDQRQRANRGRVVRILADSPPP